MSVDTSKDISAAEKASSNKESKFTVKVNDTFTGKEKEVEVSEAVYNEFNRDLWRTAKSNAKHRFYTTPFSSITGTSDEPFDAFNDFADKSEDPSSIVIEKIHLEEILAAFKPEDAELIYSLLINGFSERDFEVISGISHSTIHKRKSRVTEKLKKIYEK